MTASELPVERKLDGVCYVFVLHAKSLSSHNMDGPPFRSSGGSS